MRLSFCTVLVAALLLGCGPDSVPAQREVPAHDKSSGREMSAVAEGAHCCSCSFTETREYVANEDIPCGFEYPAHWDMSFDRGDNSLLFTAPRCETRCGSRSMSFSVARGRDNNAEYQERETTAPVVGRASCGGRDVTFYRPPGTEPAGRMGKTFFHVGRNDGRAYDAQAIFNCPEPGDWLKLEKLLVESLN